MNNLATMFVAPLLLAGVILPGHNAFAYTLKTLYGFCAQQQCTDGDSPQAALIEDGAGNLYGTTGFTVFELSPGDPWTLKTLYSFCQQKNCADGTNSYSSLIMDTAGDLYGTTWAGGAHNMGVVFELMPDAQRMNWTYQVLHHFCSTIKRRRYCADGAQPASGLTYTGAASGALYDGKSPLYGSTPNGGFSRNGVNDGVAYQLTLGSGVWTQTVIHTFCSELSCADGAYPNELTADANGNLFATTVTYGIANKQHATGVVFELSFNTKRGRWADKVLYAFCPLCGDEGNPIGKLLMDSSGDIFGATELDELFKLTPNGSGYTESVLHVFCQLQDCADGDYPQAGVVMDPSGNLFGTTWFGGGNDSCSGHGGGTAYELGLSFSVLHSFGEESQCADGINPGGNLLIDASGNIFGTTAAYGPHDGGTVFELTP